MRSVVLCQLCATTIVLLACALTGVFRPTKRGEPTTTLKPTIGGAHRSSLSLSSAVAALLRTGTH